MSETEANGSENSSQEEEEEEDYFSKFNPYTGWQTLLLLQFQNQMIFVILIGLFISCIVSLTDCAYVIVAPANETAVEDLASAASDAFRSIAAAKYSVVYAFDLLYFIDVIFMLLFKRTKWSGSMPYESRHGVMLAIELTSIIPMDLIYMVIVNSPNPLVFYCLRLRYTLRLVRLWTYFRDAKKYVGENSCVLHLVIYINYLLFKIIILGCVSYVYVCLTSDMSCTREKYTWNMGISMYRVSAVFTLVGATGFLTTFNEINNIGFTLLSFIINNYFFAFFTCAIMQTLTMKFSHLNMYTWYMLKINQWKTNLGSDWKSYHRKYQLLMKEYSNILWIKTKNQFPEKYFVEVLPPIMHKEITLDISWAPLQHTHLFRNEDVSFLRAVSAITKYEIYSPGQVIYKRNHYKHKMIYLISGVVQILSEEDSETPIIVLAAGTVLGESSLIVSCKSSSTTVTKDVCEVVTLHRRRFIRVISQLYPEKYKKLYKMIQHRYIAAQYYKQTVTHQLTTGEMDEKIGILSMQWLKLTLRRLLYDAHSLGYNLNKYYLDRLEQHAFCCDYLDLLVQANDLQLVSDSVFIRNKFPLIFKPDSILQKTWEAFMLLLAIALAWTYPIYFVYFSKLTVVYWFFFVIVTLSWFLDLYIKSSTAISTKHENYETVTGIVLYRLNTVDYIADIIAALTPEALVYMINGAISIDVARYACANRLCKVYKMHTFFTRIRGNINTHVYFKYVQNTIYLCLFLYYCATILFILAHQDTKTQQQFEKFVAKFNSSVTMKSLTLTCFAIIEFYGNLGYIDYPFLSDIVAFFILVLIQLCQYSFHLFLISTFISFEVLRHQSSRKIAEFYHNIDVTMRSYNISTHLRDRVWRYINLQREMSDTYFWITENSFRSLPRDLYIMTCGIEIGHIIKNQPLFFEFSDYMLAHIGTVSTLHLFPATEVMMYAGEVCTEIHILIDGYCTMKLQDGRSKMVEPGECLYVLEAALNIPSLVTVTALTNCKIVTITYQNFKAMLLHYPIDYDSLKLTVDNFPYWAVVKKLQRHHYAKKEIVEVSTPQPNVYCFGYQMKKRTKKFYQFHEGFPRGAFPLKYLLLRFTFYSNGKFVFYWEIMRCITALAVNILFPMSCLSSQYEYQKLHLTIMSLDALAVLDIYIRHHFSYFNHKGVEVTHPYKCASHYWKHAFLIDLLGCVNFDLIIATMFEISNRVPFYLNHILQLYRVYALSKYIFRDNMNNKGLVLMVKFVIGIILFINLLTGLTFSFACEVMVNDVVMCLNGTWISAFRGNKYQTYSVAYFYVLSGLTYSGFNTINIQTMGEIYYFMFLLVFGFLMHTVIVAKVVAISLSINIDLMSYQQKMKSLIHFMNYKKIDKNLKHEIVNHFEYMWYKTKGKNIHSAFELFRTSFKIEALYNIYGSPFKDSNIFPPPNESFFRILLIDTKHEIYLKAGIIYSVNDISGDIYLILRGRVAVVGADGNRLTTLHVGSVFGNLDNCPLGRRTLKMVASGHVELLRFSSTVFHSHLSKFPMLKRRFAKLTIFNVDYLEETRWVIQAAEPTISRIIAKSVSTHVNILSKHSIRRKQRTKVFLRHTIWIKWWESVVLNIVCVATFIFELFHLATTEDSLLFTIMLYTTDLLFVVKIYLKFHTSYEDLVGRNVKNRGLIALRYMQKTYMFYFDLFTLLPFELGSLFFLSGAYSKHFRLAWAIGRANRIFRIIMVIQYLKKMTQKLNINVFIIRSFFLLVCMIIAQITLGTILTIIMYGEYLKYEGIADREHATVQFRVKYYIYSIQAITNTCAKLIYTINIVDKKMRHAVVFILTILLSKIITVFFIAECCSIFFIVTHSRNVFEHFIVFIKQWMLVENVSQPLAERLNNYLNLLWKTTKGTQYPMLLNEAPYYLKEAVLNSLFGSNLMSHPALRHCHKDLIRQMTVCLKTLVFFSGDVVTYIGDIDSCMYFIQQGEVQAISEDTMSSEVVAQVLKTGEMFGFHQGLYERCGHQYTYKVTTYTVITYLNRKSWIYLLDFFPASEFLIYKYAKENPVG